MDTLTFEDWKKIELKIGKIIKVERVANSDKLYKLQVDLGEENQRQIVSGLVPHFTEEELLGKKIVVVSNLAPAKFRGELSNGMLLVAEDLNTKKLKLLTVNGDVAEGSTVS